MQLQNQLFNLSEETKKNNTHNGNKINSINFQKSSKEESNINSIEKKEIGDDDNKNQFELNDIKKNVNNIPAFDNKSSFIALNSISKSNEIKKLDCNYTAFSPNNNNEINNINNNNDRNFFNYFFLIIIKQIIIMKRLETMKKQNIIQ